MAEHLPSRPNLAYLRSQSKKQLVELKKRNPRAKLADAQLAVARASGFKNWPALARHVEHLRLLEGEWRFVGLQIDGDEMPAAAFGQSRLKMDGDRFRMESPEATYDGVFTIDASADPMRIDIEFVDGPEAGNQSYGIFGQDGDTLTLCLGLAGAPRPKGFSTKKGSGHALERLRRLVAGRPANVTGGTRTAKAGASQPARAAAPVDVKGFDGVVTPLLEKLQGEWAATELVADGQPMKAEWLAFGSRTTDGNEMKVVFGGQVMAHVKMRFDECASPIAVDYLNLTGAAKGQISTGIFEWAGGEAVFLIAAAGQPRPKDFAAKGKGLTLSRWRKKA